MDIRLLFTKSFRGRTFSFSVVACLFLRHVYPKFVEIWLQNLIDIIWNHSFKSPVIVWREAIFWGKIKLSALGFTSNPYLSYMYVFFQVDSTYIAGDYEGARRNSKISLCLNLLSILCLVSLAAYVFS